MDLPEKWPGASPNRFGPTRLLFSTVHSEREEHFLPPENSLLAFACNGLEEVKARRHFPARYGEVSADRKLCFKKVARSLTVPRNQTVKHVDPVFTQQRPRPERQHIKQEFPDPGPEVRQHMQMVLKANGQRPQDSASSEFDFHQAYLGRKRRVSCPRTAEPLENVVDFQPGFFRREGLFPTATYRVRPPIVNKAASGIYETVMSYEATKPRRKKWSERLREDAEMQRHTDVNSLVTW